MAIPADPNVRQTAPPLIGRDRELATLRSALASALAGHGSLVLIGGEAGIGKTALAEGVCREASAHGALALVGRCYDLTETPPYGPWVEAFDRAPVAEPLPTLPAAVLPPERYGATLPSQGAIVARVRAFLAALAGHRPVVLLLDDLHWADPASLALLRALARQLAEMPLLLLVTYRADEVTRRHPLYALLPLLEHEAPAVRLDLRPLAAAALGELVATRYALPAPDTARLVAWLHARGEGNAFFTVQLLRALEDDGALSPYSRPASAGDAGAWALGDLARVGLPLPLRQVLDARIDRLGEGASALLTLAAVIGQEVPLATWAALAGTNEERLLDTIERAADARLLEAPAAGTSVRFAHALIREALYEGLLPARRRLVHRQVGELLAGATPADPDAVASHLQRAGDDRAAEWLVRAGERAQRAAATLTAAARFEAALALRAAAGGDPAERGWLLLRVARLRRWADAPSTVAALEEAERLGAAGGDPLLAACARYWRGENRSYAGEFRRGLDELAAGLADLEALPDAELARLRELAGAGVVSPGLSGGTLAAGLGLAGRYAEVRAIAARLARGTPLSAAVGRSDEYWHALALAHAAAGQPDAAEAAWAEARASFRRQGNEVMAGNIALWELAWCARPYRADHPDACGRIAREGEGCWMRAEGAHGDMPVRALRVPLLALEGAWAEARALAAAGLRPGLSALRRALYAAELGWLARAQGDGAPGRQLVREFLPQGPDAAPGDTNYLAALSLQRLAAALALDAGDLPLARRWLAAHDTWLDWSGAVLGRADGSLGWAAYHRAAGDAAAARAHAAHALGLAGEPRQPLAMLAARRRLGALDLAEGRHADAQTHLAGALALADACAAPYERALTLLALAEVRAAVGGWAAVREALAEARAIGEGLSALPALARCDALAARLPGAPPTPGARCPVRLTAREAEVLRLLAAGMSNREMAAALCRSERTIERHLESLYRKIAARNRADATAFALRHGLA